MGVLSEWKSLQSHRKGHMNEYNYSDMSCIVKRTKLNSDSINLSLDDLICYQGYSLIYGTRIQNPGCAYLSSTKLPFLATDVSQRMCLLPFLGYAGTAFTNQLVTFIYILYTIEHVCWEYISICTTDHIIINCNIYLTSIELWFILKTSRFNTSQIDHHYNLYTIHTI